MKILGREFKISFKKQEEPKGLPSFDHVSFAVPEIPIIREVRGKEYVFFGLDNLYPQHMKMIVGQSPTQGAIIKGKSGMMAGDGFLVNGTKTEVESKEFIDKLDPKVKQAYLDFLANKNGTATLEEINAKLSYDYQFLGAMALEVVWSMDFTKIVTLKYVDITTVRTGKMHNGKVCEYWYSRDWMYYTKEGFMPQCIAAFDIKNKKDYNQLIYIKGGNLEYYGQPAYSEGISWVEIEGKLANFHLSNITNGFAPSMALKFYTKPGSPEEQSMIINGIKKQYSGTGNAGRAMVFFSDGKDLAPDISDIPVSNLDKQYTAVGAVTVQSILTANQITSPLLFGISTPGQLGGNSELATAYQILNNSVIAPDRKRLENLWNMLFAINGLGITISILPFNPLIDTSVVDNGSSTVNLLNGLSPLVATKVLEAMSPDEIRDLIGLKPIILPAVVTDPNATTTPNNIETPNA